MAFFKCAHCGNDLFDQVPGKYGLIELSQPVYPDPNVFPLHVYVCTECETVLLKPHPKAKKSNR